MMDNLLSTPTIILASRMTHGIPGRLIWTSAIEFFTLRVFFRRETHDRFGLVSRRVPSLVIAELATIVFTCAAVLAAVIGEEYFTSFSILFLLAAFVYDRVTSPPDIKNKIKIFLEEIGSINKADAATNIMIIDDSKQNLGSGVLKLTDRLSPDSVLATSLEENSTAAEDLRQGFISDPYFIEKFLAGIETDPKKVEEAHKRHISEVDEGMKNMLTARYRSTL